MPPSVCGVGAPSEFAELMITVRVKGVTEVDAPTASVRPLGFELNVRFTVFGWRLTLVVVDSPPLSVAVSCSSRKDG